MYFKQKLISSNFIIQEKRYWRRYIYIWINYALFKELEAEDIERTREVYRACLNLIPHKKFTFAKIWLYYAQFEIRQKELTSVRKILVNIFLFVCLFFSLIDFRVQPLVCVQKINFFMVILIWKFSRENLIIVENYMKNFWSPVRIIVQLGLK